MPVYASFSQACENNKSVLGHYCSRGQWKSSISTDIENAGVIFSSSKLEYLQAAFGIVAL